MIAEILGAPFQLRSGLTLKNRFAKSAMSETSASPSGDPNEAHDTMYTRFARGGLGLIITGNVMVSRDGAGEPRNVILHETRDRAAYQRWALSARSEGGAVLMQLNHAGRQSPRGLNSQPVAPSEVPLKMAGTFAKPRALAIEEIEALVQKFARAAVWAQETGFDGVQLHGAHGYLISQFLSPLTNLRTDRYGGTLENRMRFLLETYRAIRRETRFTVSLKLNSADFLRGGFEEEDAAIVARTLSEEGIDLLEISGGTYERPKMFVAQKQSTAEREAHFLEFARRLRNEVSAPLMLTGGFRTPSVMAQVVSDGSVDLIGLARPIALEPDFPAQVLAGRTQPSAAKPRHDKLAVVRAAFEGAWYQRQLHRIGRGAEPSMNASLIAAMWASTRGMLCGR